MDYKEVEKNLYGLIDYEKTGRGGYNLLNFLEVLRVFGYPNEGLKFSIIVSGTKGKGSTVHILEHIFKKCGYKVGSFTSPHLTTLRERIRVNSYPIPVYDFAYLFSEILKIIDQKSLKVSFFEVLTLGSILYFLERNVEIAIFETGLGGRLDTTALIKANYRILTTIGFDHTHILGNSFLDLVFEKVALSWSMPLLSGPQHLLVQYWLYRLSEQNGFKVYTYGREFKKEDIEKELKLIEIPRGIEEINLYAPLYLLKLMKIELTKKIKLPKLRGRFEIVSYKPLVILDTAHDPVSYRILLKNLKAYENKSPKILIFATFKDKDPLRALQLLSPFFDAIYFYPLSHPRAESSEKLKEIAKMLSIKNAKSIMDIKRLIEEAPPSALIVFTGSHYFISHLISSFFASSSVL